MPSGDIWNGGVLCVPKEIVSKQLNFANEIQIKVLLALLSNSGSADAEEIQLLLKADINDIEEALEFWAAEGVITEGGETVKTEKSEEAAAESKRLYETLPMPSLSPKDIVNICAEQPELASLLRGAEKTLASSLSNSMKSNLINMVTYYGLPVPIVLTLLEYYKSERESGKSITTRALQNTARQWADDGVDTLEAASAKLQELISSDELWGEIINLCEFDYRKPTAAQKKMIIRWQADFEKEMLFFACNTMKKYTDEDKRSLKEVDNILKSWKRKGFKTPDDVKAAPKKEAKKDGKLKGTPSFDIEEISKRSILNDDFDI